jgi:hypothetical protein
MLEMWTYFIEPFCGLRIVFTRTCHQIRERNVTRKRKVFVTFAKDRGIQENFTDVVVRSG